MLLFICVSLTYIFPFVFVLRLSMFVFYLKCYCSFVFLIFLWFVFLLPIYFCIFVFYMCSICVWKYKLNYGQPVRTNPAPCLARISAWMDWPNVWGIANSEMNTLLDDAKVRLSKIEMKTVPHVWKNIPTVSVDDDDMLLFQVCEESND